MTELSMTEPEPDERDARQVRQGLLQRRRARIVAEIERNRRGEYTVPTWVLVAVLLVVVAAWAALIIFA